MRSKLAELIPTPATKSAPVILVAVSEEKINQASGAAHFAFDTQDYAAAVENILLGAVGMGYTAVWMDGMTRMEEKDADIAALLNVPADKKVRSIIPIGVPEKEALSGLFFHLQFQVIHHTVTVCQRIRQLKSIVCQDISFIFNTGYHICVDAFGPESPEPQRRGRRTVTALKDDGADQGFGLVFRDIFPCTYRIVNGICQPVIRSAVDQVSIAVEIRDLPPDLIPFRACQCRKPELVAKCPSHRGNGPGPERCRAAGQIIRAG